MFGQVDCGAAPGAWSQVAAGKVMNIPIQPNGKYNNVCIYRNNEGM